MHRPYVEPVLCDLILKCLYKLYFYELHSSCNKSRAPEPYLCVLTTCLNENQQSTHELFKRESILNKNKIERE